MPEQTTKTNKHLARMFKDVGSVPAHADQIEAWGAACKTEFMSPEHKR